eukprot:CAMPEP_0172861458 /NCGR_PEP_ID=MMETSP1075-20121228/72670_1 /TAXON_ID=2916 /ORGANISM="Ceratium fusus, Strain PA161109" /LENGTH=322 /DNA_ID=CAMNT_0013709597 /DNA_START=27 /DNA_END=991 /DNA_ORIENTATION=-
MSASVSLHSDLRGKFTELVEEFLRLSGAVDERLLQLEAKEAKWEKIKAEVHHQATESERRVKLNVGGRGFTASRSTLLRWEGTYFHALLGSGQWEPCGDDGAYFIDRDAGPFEAIMASFRSGEPVDFCGLRPSERKRLQDECQYYQLPNHIVFGGLHWDSSRCGSTLSISDGGHTVTKTGGDSACDAAVLATTEASGFRVRIRQLGPEGDLMVGYANSDSFEANGQNYDRSGWFLSCDDGRLYSSCLGRGVEGISAAAGMVPSGSLVEVQYDAERSRISFSVDGEARGTLQVRPDPKGGTAAPSLRPRLLPCVEIYSVGASA